MYACSCCQKAVFTSSLHHLFTVHEPPPQEHKSLIALETAIPTNDCVSSTRLTTLHLTIYLEGGDTCTLGLITAQWHHWKLPIPALSVKSEAGGILWILSVGGRGWPSEISLRKNYQPLKRRWHVLHSTLHFLTWHNHWSNNGRQAKARIWGNVTLENLFIEQLMSNKQLLNEGGLSRGDRQNRLYSVGRSLWLTKLWTKSESWEVVPPEQRSAAVKGAAENRKQGAPWAFREARVAPSIVSKDKSFKEKTPFKSPWKGDYPLCAV